MMLTPRRPKSPKSPNKRSYLDKGPTKEQLQRRHLLKSKLQFDDDDDDDDDDDSSDGFVDLNDAPSGDGDEDDMTTISTSTRRGKMRERLSRSLSPKSFGRRVLGRRERSRDRIGEQAEDQNKEVTKSPKLRRRSRSTTGYAPVEASQSSPASRRPRPPQRSQSINANDAAHRSPKPRRSMSGDGYRIAKEASHSLSPKRALRRFGNKDAPESGLEGMRRSLIADKKQLDNLESQFDHEDEPPDDETLLERVARRVAAKRKGKLQRSRTDGDDIAAMQAALKRRQEKEREDDEGIGGLWAMGLKALEKVYDDIS